MEEKFLKIKVLFFFDKSNKNLVKISTDFWKAFFEKRSPLAHLAINVLKKCFWALVISQELEVF